MFTQIVTEKTRRLIDKNQRYFSPFHRGGA
jgi:hypothetical protein